MNFLVLLKQVPDTEKVRIDKNTGTMIRKDLDITINPLDLHALEIALSYRKDGDKVTVISMGPPNTEQILRDAIALGADEAFLISDRVFAGADTLATSYTLYKAIEYLNLPFDIILSGEKSTDGETGQVGIELSVLLGLPALNYVSKILKIEKDHIIVEVSMESEFLIFKAKYPVLISVLKSVSEPRFQTLSGKKKAMKAKINVITNEELELNPDQVGLKGSPTRVILVYTPKFKRECEIYEGENLEKGIEKTFSILKSFIKEVKK